MMNFNVVEPQKKTSVYRVKSKGKRTKPSKAVYIEHFGNNLYGINIDGQIYYIENDNIDELTPKDGVIKLRPSAMNDYYNAPHKQEFSKITKSIELDSYLRKTEEQKIILNALWKPFYTGQRVLQYVMSKEPQKVIITNLSKR